MDKLVDIKIHTRYTDTYINGLEIMDLFDSEASKWRSNHNETTKQTGDNHKIKLYTFY